MQHESPRPPPAPSAPAVSATPDRAHWTPAKQRAFLYALAETGSVAQAARAVGMSRSSAHRLRARLAGTLFDRTWGMCCGFTRRSSPIRSVRMPLQGRMTAIFPSMRRAGDAGPSRRCRVGDAQVARCVVRVWRRCRVGCAFLALRRSAGMHRRRD